MEYSCGSLSISIKASSQWKSDSDKQKVKLKGVEENDEETEASKNNFIISL